MKKINISEIISDLKSHWSEPAEGKYVSYKEFTAYSVGGIGVNTMNALSGYVGLSASCLLLGSAYGISPMDLAVMSLIVNIINLIKAPFVSMLIDNTNSKYGKFRPYLLYMGVPSIALLVLMACIPTDINYTLKCALLCLTYTLLLFFLQLYATAFTSLAQVLTPNGDERTSLLSISQFVYSLGPSIVNMLFPILAGLFAGGMTGFTAYRVLFPIFSIIGIMLGMLTFKGTKEKIIAPKDYVAKVKFSEGIRDVKNNKYFWLLTLYSIAGWLKYSTGSILTWYCIYVIKSDASLGIANTIIGTASVPGMLLAPIFAKKLGKRSTLIAFNIARATFTAVMFFTGNHAVIFLACFYLATLAVGGDAVITNSAMADIFDYQQWKTGKRLEGFITQFSGMLTTAAGMGLNLILPWFFERYGLKNDYAVLFDPAVRTPIFNIMIIITVISCVATVIPMLFYDMTEKKQAQMIEDLRQLTDADSENVSIIDA